MMEKLRLLRHVVRMKDDRLSKIVLLGQPSGAKRIAVCPRLGWDNVIKKNLKEGGNSWESVKRHASNRLGRSNNCVFIYVFFSKTAPYFFENWYLGIFSHEKKTKTKTITRHLKDSPICHDIVPTLH